MREVTRFTLDDKAEIDRYLDDLFKNPSYRTMHEVTLRLDLISDSTLRSYYLEKAESLLKQ